MAYSDSELSIGAGRGQPRAGNNARIDQVGANDNPSVRGSMPVTGDGNTRTFQGASGAVLKTFGDAVIATPAEIQAANSEAKLAVDFAKRNWVWIALVGFLAYSYLFKD